MVLAPAAADVHLAKTDLPWLAGAMLAGGVAAPILLSWAGGSWGPRI